MGYEISYKNKPPRQALIDLARWMELRRMKIILRGMRACRTMADIDSINIAISFGGVDGEPVRRLIAYVWGEETLQQWSKAKQGDLTPIVGILRKPGRR